MIAETIKQEVANLCAVEPSQIRSDGWLIEYGLDSLRSMELIVTLEEHFAIEAPDEELSTLITVGDVIALVERQLVAA